jgi:hypothetical protein
MNRVIPRDVELVPVADLGASDAIIAKQARGEQEKRLEGSGVDAPLLLLKLHPFFIAGRAETVHLERAESPTMFFYVCVGFEATAVNEDSPRKTRQGTSPALALEY